MRDLYFCVCVYGGFTTCSLYSLSFLWGFFSVGYARLGRLFRSDLDCVAGPPKLETVPRHRERCRTQQGCGTLVSGRTSRCVWMCPLGGGGGGILRVCVCARDRCVSMCVYIYLIVCGGLCMCVCMCVCVCVCVCMCVGVCVSVCFIA